MEKSGRISVSVHCMRREVGGSCFFFKKKKKNGRFEARTVGVIVVRLWIKKYINFSELQYGQKNSTKQNSIRLLFTS